MIGMLSDPIPTEGIPTRFHSLQQVISWHIRRVILDSYSLKEAAHRLGVSPRGLQNMRRDHNICDLPIDPRREKIERL